MRELAQHVKTLGG